MDINKPWYLGERLSRTEKEGLFILLETAGVSICSATRDHEGVDRFPYLLLCEYEQPEVTATLADLDKARIRGLQIVTYPELINAIKEEIKLKSKEAWI